MNNNEDLTFIVPIRIDSVIRLENFMAILRFLRSFRANIFIIESIKHDNKVIKRILPKDKHIKYYFFEDKDIVFFRTHIINLALDFVTTTYVAVWDADVIVDYKQINESMEILRKGEYDISFPYNGIFLNTDDTFRSQYLQTGNIKLLLSYKNYLNILYSKNFVGGGFIINRDKYIEAGKENENFYGWGPEDLDRVLRWKNMGYKIHRSQGPMFHLCHPRNMNGTIRSSIQKDLCMLQLSNSKYSSQYEICINLTKNK